MILSAKTIILQLKLLFFSNLFKKKSAKKDDLSVKRNDLF